MAAESHRAYTPLEFIIVIAVIYCVFKYLAFGPLPEREEIRRWNVRHKGGVK